LQDLKGLERDGLWEDLKHHNPHGFEFQILTKEFIKSFSDFLAEEINKIPKEKLNILEVGAGNGRLTYFLKEAIKDKAINKEIVFRAIDDFSWDSDDQPFFWTKKIFPVENISVEESIKSNPDIVISSWMPKDEDWTVNFRTNPNIQEFILIGTEMDCGNKNSWVADENFKRKEVPTHGNVCWTDFAPRDEGKSKVFAFSR